MTFDVGTFVRLRTDAGRAGVLQPGEGKIVRGQRMVPVLFQDGSISHLPESLLEAVPANPLSLIERFEQGEFVSPSWLRRELARNRVTGRLDNIVYSMEATETNFYAHQFKPVLKLLSSPTDGLLIADEVGLGKTIEAGLIWTELRARLESDRLLVLCPKTLCEKWRMELERRFGVLARIVDAEELLQLVSTEGSRRGFAAIASMQSIRPPRGWNDVDDTTERIQSARARLAQFLSEAAEGTPLLDLLIIDEAHHMRNPETMLHNLARLLNAVAAHRVFLSATPIHLRNRDLHSLLNLIDSDTFEYDSALDDLIRSNAPIIEARDILLKPKSSKRDVINKINVTTQYGSLAESKSIRLLLDDLAKTDLTPQTRAEFAYRLEQANQLSNYVTRTRRRDVEELRVQRDPKTPILQMHPDERAFYDAVVDAVTEYALDNDVSAGFLLAMPLRLLASSPAAASRYWSAIAEEQSTPEEDTDEDLESEAEEDNRPLVSLLSRLAKRLELSEQLFRIDTKYALLRSQLSQIWSQDNNAKLIIFSSFKPTLEYLKRRLESDSVICDLLHGSIKEPRNIVLNRFKERPDAAVLLSSEVGSEGVDLQFCWIVINYDLPWNPMKLEQRIGRVDRLGQEKPVVAILNLIYDGTIDKSIYQRLYERLGLVTRALGEFEAILGDPIREMTKKLVDPNLNEDQKLAAIDQTALALESQRVREQELEAEAGSLLRHGDYILRTIYDSRHLHRWLNDDDVLIYVRDRLLRSFQGCIIETSPPGSDTYRISLSAEAHGEFASFLRRRGLHGTTRLIGSGGEVKFRFTARVLRSTDSRVENISQLHPIVRFAAELDQRDEAGKIGEPVAATIEVQQLSQPCDLGMYLIAIRRWSLTTSGGGITNTSRIAYAGVSMENLEVLDPDIVEELAGAVAASGKAIENAREDARISKASSGMKEVVFPELDRRFGEFIAQFEAQAEDRAGLRRRALERHRDSRSMTLNSVLESHIAKAKSFVRSGDSRKAKTYTALVAATEAKLKKLHESCQRRLVEIESERKPAPEESEIAVIIVEVV
ncbi:MAG: DEAD/DEAH box helicase [Xanthobacteraceae bacterium]|nr:DEAD/DEAH box helicase [Xanthobacteraceae bacterium]